MNLVADRFVVRRDSDALDLATGESVLLVTSAAGEESEGLRWAVRCDWLYKTAHPAVASLLDYGLLGSARRFEAWRCGATWTGDSRQAERVLQSARRFFQANRLTQPDDSPSVVRLCAGEPVVLPTAAVGYPADVALSPFELTTEMCGVSRLVRPELALLAETFSESRAQPARMMSLWGEPGAGLRTMISDLSRIARMQGFVPMAGAGRSPWASELLRRRPVLLICARANRGDWADVVRVSLEGPQPLVVLFVGRNEVRHVDGVQLRPTAPEGFVRAVRPVDIDERVRRQVEVCADRAAGLPGRFARLMWHRALYHAEGRSHSKSIAAEPRMIYGEEPIRPSREHVDYGPSSISATSGVSALRNRLECGIDQVRRGRHAAGTRLLRQAIGGLARRRDWPHAVRGALSLAGALLSRGRAHDAQSVLDDVKTRAHEDADRGALIEAAILKGVVAIDLGRLDEAETILASVHAAARTTGNAIQVVRSGLSLARCLFWCGEYERAAHVVAALDHDTADAGTAVRLAVTGSRIAIGRRDLAAAVAQASTGVDAAERLGNHSLLAYAHGGMALAHLTVGDRAAVQRDVALAVAAAREAREPLRALKARLTGVEASRRAGQHRASAQLTKRLSRIPTPVLPATVRARANLLRELLQSATPAESIRRQIAATGLKALVLFAPDSIMAGGGALQHAAADMSEILQCCQTAEDEASVPGEICHRVKARLGAIGVALFAKGNALPLASAGSRIEPDVAVRVLLAGEPVAPHLQDGRIEGGVPVRYGGETIGVIAGRWPLGASNDLERAAAVLRVAAGIAGPFLAAALAQRADEDRRPPSDLLGISPAIVEVRRTVDRAAGAPFAVLVQGESGCGKELVARALHRRSPRCHRPFCALNCAALPDELVETELFGHARGAFTGAAVERVGVFEEAAGGTLFLDEIGELSPRAQAKVLRAIQEGEIRRVGENSVRKIDVRIVSATNRDLHECVASGRFRMDLLYRLDVIRIRVPALRDRREDIAALADRFWRESTQRVGSRAALSAATIAALAQYDWPGNVRELQNVLAALAVRVPRRGVVSPTALPPNFQRTLPAAASRLEEARRSFDEQFVRAALVRTGGRRGRAAEELGLTRQGLTKLMARLGIESAALL